MNIRSRFLLAAFSAAFASVACSGSNVDQSPLTEAAFGAGTDASPLTGTVTGLAGSCPTVTFTIERRIIKTDASTSFGAAGCVALKNLVRVEVAGTEQADGSLKATRVGLVASVTPVEPPKPPVPTPNGVVSVSGGVHALTGTCPSVTFTIEARTVKTNASTVFGDGGCAALKNDVRAEIAGTVQADGSVLASKVAVVPIVAPPAVPPSVPPVPVPAPTPIVSVVGTVKSFAGTCPVVSFAIETRIVKTNSSTAFGNGGCAAIKNDVRVELSGTVQADGSILALKVGVTTTTTTVPPPPPPPPPPLPTPVAPPTVSAISGNITSIAGTCPALIITVGERKAITTASTVFEVKSCGELAVGAYVEIAVAPGAANIALTAIKVTARR